MSDDLKKTLPKIRTFAQDLERQRVKSGQPLPDDAKIPVAVSKPSSSVTPTMQPLETVAPSAVTHIPAFHELQKKVASDASATPSVAVPKAPVILRGPTITTATPVPAIASAPKKIKVRTQKREVKNEKKITKGGTVITDTKKGDFKLLPSILHSIDRWIASVGKIFKRKKAPTYSIAATDRRKGVIQKATTKTATIFTADNETLKEEIRRRQLTQSNQHDPRDGKPEILWSPNTESGYALLENETGTETTTPAIANKSVAVEFKKRSVPPIPVFVEPTKPIVIAEIPPEPTPVYTAPPVTQPTPSVLDEEVLDTIEPEEEVEEAEIPVEVEEELVPEETEVTIPKVPRVSNRLTLASLNTNTLAISLVGTIACFILVIVVAREAIELLMPKTQTEIVLATAKPIIKNATISDLKLMSMSSETLLTELRALNTTNTAVHEMRFVDQDGVAIPAKKLLNLMAFNTNPNFNQSVTDIHIATVNTNRALVFTVADTTTALGALLEWESTMATDVGPILGIPKTDAVNSFVDQTYSSTDIRILKAGDQPILVYGFIDENTVVITKDIPSFTKFFGE